MSFLVLDLCAGLSVEICFRKATQCLLLEVCLCLAPHHHQNHVQTACEIQPTKLFQLKMESLLDPKKARKRPNEEETVRFTNAFFGFYFFVGLVCWWIIYRLVLDDNLHGSSPGPLPWSCPNKEQDLKNLYAPNFLFDFHAFLSENETHLNPQSQLISTGRDISYGDGWSHFHRNTNVSISEVGRS